MQVVVAGLAGFLVGAIFDQGLKVVVTLVFVLVGLFFMISALGGLLLEEEDVTYIRRKIGAVVRGWFE